jgi:hypothetical protein
MERRWEGVWEGRASRESVRNRRKWKEERNLKGRREGRKEGERKRKRNFSFCFLFSILSLSFFSYSLFHFQLSLFFVKNP